MVDGCASFTRTREGEGDDKQSAVGRAGGNATGQVFSYEGFWNLEDAGVRLLVVRPDGRRAQLLASQGRACSIGALVGPMQAPVLFLGLLFFFASAHGPPRVVLLAS